MSDIVSGYQNQIWLVAKMDGLSAISEERIPLAEASETQIIQLIEERAAAELTQREREESPDLYKLRPDRGNGNRLIYTAGQNPYYVASLWRVDELSP